MIDGGVDIPRLIGVDFPLVPLRVGPAQKEARVEEVDGESRQGDHSAVEPV